MARRQSPVADVQPSVANRQSAVDYNLLFERHFEPLTRFVARIVHSPQVAADLVQDVFLRVWSRRAELEVHGNLQSYLRRAARNRALDWLRRESLHRQWEEAAIRDMRAQAIDAHAAEHDSTALLLELVSEMLAEMPSRRRAACELRWREGLGPTAIAARLGVSVKTIETHLTRGLKDVRCRAVAEFG